MYFLHNYNQLFLPTDLKDIKSFVRLGIMLVYSTERHASLAVMKSLLSKLPSLPKLIVAMAAGGTHSNKLLEEGRELANSYNATFVCNNGATLPCECTLDVACDHMTLRLDHMTHRLNYMTFTLDHMTHTQNYTIM